MERSKQVEVDRKAEDKAHVQDDSHRKSSRWKKRPVVIRYGKH